MIDGIDIEGGLEIERALEKLGPKLAKKALVSSFRAGANIVKKDAQSRVPQRSKNLHDAIVVRRPNKKMKVPNDSVLTIAIKKPQSRRAHLTEFGTGPRVQKTTGRSTGSSPAKPFLRPALDGQGRKAVKVIMDKLWANIEKIVNEQNKNK